jgi:pimeloyl-ACP methyl ester carboxylesterase
MCALMNFVQARHGLAPESCRVMEQYVAASESLGPEQFYDHTEEANRPALTQEYGATVSWPSPVVTNYPKNNSARVQYFPSAKGWSAPTVLMLHALMSAADRGYRRWAARFNSLGWNACFLHLPYHYSRVPPGFWNGELAMTSDLVRNAQGLRQAVMEVRQLITVLREAGSAGVGLLGTSYGAWVAALTCTVEPDLMFAALMAPIVNVDHALWRCPASMTMRFQLARAGITPSLVSRHFHLSSPSSMTPVLPGHRIVFAAGEYDLVAPAADIIALHERWKGSALVRVPQGHFGYRMMRETFEHLRKNHL